MNKTKNTASHNLKSFKRALPIFGVILITIIIAISSVFYTRYISITKDHARLKSIENTLRKIQDASTTSSFFFSTTSKEEIDKECTYSAFYNVWTCNIYVVIPIKAQNKQTMVQFDKIILDDPDFKKNGEDMNHNNISNAYISYGIDSDPKADCVAQFRDADNISLGCTTNAQKSWYPNSEPEYSTAPGKDAWRE